MVSMQPESKYWNLVLWFASSCAQLLSVSHVLNRFTKP